MPALSEILKLATALAAIGTDGYALPAKGPVRVVKFLRKSKANAGNDTSLSFDGQNDMCDAYLRTRHGKHKVVTSFKSMESGMKLHRPDLFKALRACVANNALFLVAKVDRSSRNIIVFTLIMEMGIPIEFAEYPSINFHHGTIGEKSAIWRAAMEGYLEGLRISDRTRAVMPRLKKAGVKMGGRAHKQGSIKMRTLAEAEAKSIKKHITTCQNNDPDWSAPKVAAALNGMGLRTRAEKPFTATVVRSHMKRLNMWF